MKAGSWPSIILIYLFSVCAGGAIGKIIPLVGVLAQALHVGPDRAAWLISAVLPASVVLAPFGGALSDRLGDRRLTAIGLCSQIFLSHLGMRERVWLSRSAEVLNT